MMLLRNSLISGVLLVFCHNISAMSFLDREIKELKKSSVAVISGIVTSIKATCTDLTGC